MLCNLVIHNSLLAHGLFNCGKEVGFFIMMMFLDEVMPRKAVADKVVLIWSRDSWRLLIDAVITANYGIVTQCHG